MIIYDNQHLLEHSVIQGAYLTIVGDFEVYGRPQVVNYLMNRRRGWRNNYELAYNEFKAHPEIGFQLMNYAYLPFEHIPNTPSHLLMLYYEDISAIHSESLKFKRDLVECLLSFSDNYNMPLYIPYKIDSIISEEVWNNVVLPMIVQLYGNKPNKKAVIMPSITIANRERM